MKFASIITALALVSAQDVGERKVPPRHPLQRLNTLKRFAGEWINSQIGSQINRPQRARNMIDNGINRLFSRMTEAFNKDCGYYNPNVPNGGPDPNASRKKRSAFVQKELSRIAREVSANDDIDIFDAMEANYERGMGDGDLRLSNDVNLAWKQIGTGFRKWILRYISACNGQKQFSYHTGRLAKIHGNVKLAFDTVGASQQEDYENFDGNDYDNQQ